MKRVLLLAAAFVAGCGSSQQQGTTTTTPTTVAATTTTVATKTVRQWAVPSLPYITQMETAFDEGGKAATARPLNLDAVRSAAQSLADASRGFRLSLETSGPVPTGAAVQGPAVIEATRDLEQKARTLAGCISTSGCTAAVSAMSVAFASWGSAVQELTKVINS